MLKLKRLNKAQIKAIANLFIEIGKWLLLSVVFSAFLMERKVEIREIVFALILALILIITAIRLLKEVKEK